MEFQSFGSRVRCYSLAILTWKGPEAIKEVLTNTTKFPKLEQSYRALKEYIGDGLVTAEVFFHK